MNVVAHICFCVCMCVPICCKVCVLKCVQEGADTDGRGVMSGPRTDKGNTIHRGGGWIRDTAEKEMGEKSKKREIQGEVLLSLTTKMEVRQGQIVGDHLTVEKCTGVIFPEIRGHHCSLLSKPKPELLKNGEFITNMAGK